MCSEGPPLLAPTPPRSRWHTRLDPDTEPLFLAASRGEALRGGAASTFSRFPAGVTTLTGETEAQMQEEQSRDRAGGGMRARSSGEGRGAGAKGGRRLWCARLARDGGTDPPGCHPTPSPQARCRGAAGPSQAGACERCVPGCAHVHARVCKQGVCLRQHRVSACVPVLYMRSHTWEGPDVGNAPGMTGGGPGCGTPGRGRGRPGTGGPRVGADTKEL